MHTEVGWCFIELLPAFKLIISTYFEAVDEMNPYKDIINFLISQFRLYLNGTKSTKFNKAIIRRY
jgi:hypothetical protein